METLRDSKITGLETGCGDKSEALIARLVRSYVTHPIAGQANSSRIATHATQEHTELTRCS